jgi:hypothetical protein
MAYNKFRWWTKGKTHNPLKADAPLLLKIRNGDFDYSYMFGEAKEMRATSQKVYEQAYKNYGGTDEQNRIQAALEASQMKRVKALKLEFEANRDENMILYKLRSELTKEFGNNLFEEKKSPKFEIEPLTHRIYDFPCSSKPFEAVYNVKKKLPLFAKSAKSKSQYCAGYYVIKFRKGWVKSYCPKLITLERYPFHGPFKSELEMKTMQTTVNKNETT